jgi:hypothetical protein
MDFFEANQRLAKFDAIYKNLALGRDNPDVVASRQYFADLAADPPLATPTALTATTIEALWPAAQFTPIQAFEPRVGKLYNLRAGGIWSTSTSGTLIITPTLTGAGSGAMGVSQTQTIPFSMTAVPWRLQAELVIRTVGVAGANSTCMLVGTFQSGGLTTNASPGGSINLGFGGTSAAFDATILQALQIQKTLSVAGSFSTHYAVLQSLN